MYLEYHELDAEIIIVGAGIEGMSAAYLLHEKEPYLNITVLDVNDKNNSKNLEDEDENTNYQYHFACSKQKDLIELISKLNIPLLIPRLSGNILVDYDQIYKVNGKENLFTFFTKNDILELKSFIKTIDKLKKSVTFKNFKMLLDWRKFETMNMENFIVDHISSLPVQNVIKQTILINLGAKASDISVLFYLAFCSSIKDTTDQFMNEPCGLHQYWTEGGSRTICERIKEIIGQNNVVRVQKIIDVNETSNGVEIVTDLDKFFSRKVIFTVFGEEIKNIHFGSTFIPDKHHTCEKRLKKFSVFYSKPFWYESNWSGNIYVLNTINQNGPIQICFDTSTSFVFSLTGLTIFETSSSRKNVTKQLANYFGNKALYPVKYIEKLDDCSFLNSKFSNCTLSLDTRKLLREPSGRIFWGSSELSTKWHSLLAGSIRIGYTTSLQALYDVRPTALDIEDTVTISSLQDRLKRRADESAGFRIKWHIVVPTVLLSLYILRKLYKKGYLSSAYKLVQMLRTK